MVDDIPPGARRCARGSLHVTPIPGRTSLAHKVQKRRRVAHGPTRSSSLRSSPLSGGPAAVMPASCPVYCIRATCHVPQRTMDNHPRIVPRGGGSRRTRIYGIVLETNTPRTPVNELQEDRQGHEGLAHRHEGAPQSILSTARGRAVFFSPFVLRLNRNADPTTRRERQAGPSHASHHRTAATKEPSDQARSGTSRSTSRAKARSGSGESIPRSGWEPYNAMPYGGDPGSSVNPCAGAEAGSPDARRKMQDARRLGTWVAF